MIRTSTFACIAALATCVVPASHAAEYTFTPRVDVRLSGDDNLQIAVEERAIEGYSVRVSPALNVAYRGDRLQVLADTRLDFTRFDDVDFDTDDQFVSFTMRYGGETSMLQLDLNTRRQSQRTSEVLDTGLLGGVDRVESHTVRPSYVRALNELYRITVGASWTGQQYDLTNFADYKNVGFDVSLARQMSETQSIDLTLFASEFETEARLSSLRNPRICDVIDDTTAIFCLSGFSRTQTSTLGAQLGYRHVLTESSQFGLSIGVRDVDARDINTEVVGCAVDTRFLDNITIALLIAEAQGRCGLTGFDLETSVGSSGLITRAFFENSGERTKWSASFERSVSPVGLGFLIETDRLQGRFDYRFSPTLTSITRLTAQQTGAVASEVDFDRDYYAINSALTWRMREHWRLSSGVALRQQKASFLIDTARSLSAYVEVTYSPRGIKVSR